MLFENMHYGFDHSDMVIRQKPDKPKFTTVCGCEDGSHEAHEGKKCEVLVTRNAVPSKGHYMCYDCKHANQMARDRIRTARLKAERALHGGA